MANQFARRLWQVMALSTLLTVALTTAGLMVSYGPSLPPGAVYLLVVVVARLRKAGKTS